jgi:hypothetical protein
MDPGDITFAGGAHLDFNGGVIRTLALLADRDINFGNGSRINLTGAAHDIVLNARAAGGAVGAITIDNAGRIATSGGAVSLVGGVGGTGFAIGRSGNQTGVEIHGTLSLSGGAVTIRGQGAAGEAGANGVSLGSAKIDAGVGGSITVAGIAGDLDSVGVKIDNSDLIAPGGALNLVSDSLSVASSTINLTDGSLTIQASLPSISIGMNGAAGGLQLPASLFAGISGSPSSITIGRSDQTAPINIAAGLVLGADMTFLTGGGSVGFAGAVNGAAVGQQSLTISSGTGAVHMPVGAGGMTALSSITTDAATLGGLVQTSGAQHFGNLVLTGDTVLRTLAAGSDVSVSGTINSATGIPSSLAIDPIGGGATLLSGPIGLGAPLQNLSITSTGSQILLPTSALSGNLSIASLGGAVLQSGAISAAGVVSISAGSVVLSDPVNFIQTAALTLTAAGLSQIVTNAPVMTIGASIVAGGLAITTLGGVAQSGPLAAGSLALLGSGGVYTLNDPGNLIGTLAADTASVVLRNEAVGGLSMRTVGATTGVTVTGSAAIKTAGPLSGWVAVGSGSLTIEAQGGEVTAIVGGLTGAAAASAVMTPTGHVMVNGTGLSSFVPIVPPPILPEVVVPAILPTAPLPPPPVDVIVLPIIVVATAVAGVPSVDPLVVVHVVAPVKPAELQHDLHPFETPEASGLDERVEVLDLHALETVVERAQHFTGQFGEGASLETMAGMRTDARLATVLNGEGGLSAEAQRSAFAATPSGGLLPGTPSSVGETGQALISTRTVKIDAADAGGEGGQVIYASETLKSDGFPGLPSQLWEILKPRRVKTLEEPLLSEQPPTLNEEALMD